MYNVSHTDGPLGRTHSAWVRARGQVWPISTVHPDDAVGLEILAGEERKILEEPANFEVNGDQFVRD